MLKFSGEVRVASGQTLVTFLGDAGINITAQSISISPPSYPTPIDRNLRNLATNLFATLLADQQVVFELVKNLSTVPVVVATITYGPLEGGIKAVQFGPTLFVGFPSPDTLDLRVTTSNINSEAGAVSVSAAVGTE